MTSSSTSFSQVFCRGSIIAAVLLALYFGAYFATVTRSESRSAPQMTAEGQRTYMAVGADLWRGRIGYLLFGPAQKIDRTYFRRRYWSGYYVVVTKAGTNLDYECDWKRP
jgi:hypothetical protein